MLRKNCLIKISGDLFKDEVFEWIKSLTKKYFVVVCVGGGTQISEALIKAGFSKGEFGPLGRELKTFEQKQLARDVLEKNQVKLQDRLAKMGVQVAVVIPVIDVGSVLCHVNGDQYVINAYHGFDLSYIITTTNRVGDKKKFFKPYYPKIKVKAFDF